MQKTVKKIKIVNGQIQVDDYSQDNDHGVERRELSKPFNEYMVSKEGQIRNKRGMIIKPKIKRGYVVYCLYTKDRRRMLSIGRAVYEAFVGKIPKGYVIYRKDRNRANNRLENLDIIKNGYATTKSFLQ